MSRYVRGRGWEPDPRGIGRNGYTMEMYQQAVKDFYAKPIQEDPLQAARDRWKELPDKTWEEGTGFVKNPEKWRFGWLSPYVGIHGGHGDRFLHSLKDRNRGGAGIKTASQQLADRQPQQHAAEHGKPTPDRSLKINKTGTTPSADEPMSMSGTDDTMQIGGKKRKPDAPSAGHNMSINI